MSQYTLCSESELGEFAGDREVTGECGAELELRRRLRLCGVVGAELDRCLTRVSGGGGGRSDVELELRCGGGADLELGRPCVSGGGVAELELGRSCVSGGGGGSADVGCRQGTLVRDAPVDKSVRSNIVR